MALDSRKWATERKGYPVRDVMEAGGWKIEETLLRSYQEPDAETVRRVVLHPTQRIVSRWVRLTTKLTNTGCRRRKSPTAKVAAGLIFKSRDGGI